MSPTKRGDMTEVRVEEAEARRLAAVRGSYTRPTLSTVMISLLDKVYAFLNERQIGGRGCNVVIYDGPSTMVAGVEIAGPFEPAREVIAAETPAGRVVTAQHVGRYQEMGRTYDAIQMWLKESGERETGVSWEVYGDWEEDESKLLTDIYFQLAD